jgi:hypothetical protein
LVALWVRLCYNVYKLTTKEINIMIERIERSYAAKALCDEFNTDEGCGDCPIKSPCAPHAGDSYTIWLERTNKAAAEIK